MAGIVVEENNKESSRVMVAIDENESSCYALKWALQNLQESVFKSSNPLILFMVLPSSATNGGGGGRGSNFFSASLGSPRIISGSELVNSVQERNSMVAEGILEKAKSICASHGINAETISVVGGAKEAICEGVKKYKINLLVLGDHGTGKFKRTLQGSVSNYCITNAKCPVLFVKRPK